jgi:hypothetical protein
MKQYEAVIRTLENLGGVATLGQLYSEVFKITECEWGTRTPLATIRRIVQTRKEIYKLKPGLYGLTAKRREHEASGLLPQAKKGEAAQEAVVANHTYYQGLLLIAGKLKGLECWSPNQDKNRRFLDSSIESLRTLQTIPQFSYEHLVNRSATVDVIWFNERRMPSSFFEIEQSSDIQNSLLKFNDLQDFHARMVIVSDARRKQEYEHKIKYTSFRDISQRVTFLPYDWLVKEYEHAIESSRAEMSL